MYVRAWRVDRKIARHCWDENAERDGRSRKEREKVEGKGVVW